MATSNQYQNPLDSFRSYAYHFTLVVSNSSEAHRRLLEQSASGGAAFRDKVNEVGLGGEINLGGEKAYLLLDTRRFSQFTVDSFECQHIFGTGDIRNPTVPSATSLMKITDSTGLSFFNFLMDIMKNKLRSTRASAFFMLAISFVGHEDFAGNPDDWDPSHSNVDNCFMTMFLLNLGFEFTSKGSNFDLEFVEIEGNPGQGIPEMLDLSGAMAVSTENKSNSVGGMIQALEDNLNISSLQFYNKYTNVAYQNSKAITGQVSSGVAAPIAGKLVQYMLTLPPEWREYQLNTAEKSRHVEQVFAARKKKISEEANKVKEQVALEKGEEEANKAKESYIAFASQMSIPDAISIILESSRQYLDKASIENRKKGEAVVHKTIVNVTSDISTYLIHYDIYPMYATIPPKDNGTKTDAVKVSAGRNQRLPNGKPRNVIEYDYLFTGKNSHVLDLRVEFSPNSAVGLDMDLDMGQKRLADNAQAGSKGDEIKKNQDGEIKKTYDFSPLIKPGEPIFMPTVTASESKNFAQMYTEEFGNGVARKMIRAKQEYDNTMAFLHFIGSMQAQLTIRGNPNLIKKYGDRKHRGGIPSHPASIITPKDLEKLVELPKNQIEDYYRNRLTKSYQSARDEYFRSYVKPRQDDTLRSGANDPLLDGPDIAVGPVFVKVNIKAPNLDLAGNRILETNDDGDTFVDDLFTNKFFYNGYYMIMNMTTTFELGNFKHTLLIAPLDFDGSFSLETSASPASAKTKTV